MQLYLHMQQCEGPLRVQSGWTAGRGFDEKEIVQYYGDTITTVCMEIALA